MGTSGQSPYNIKNSGRRVQVMVLASDILTEGGAAGAIQRLAWNIAATGTGAVNGYTIRMAHYTTGGDFFPGTNFFTPSSWTTVYSGNFAPAGTGFQDIIFTSNFNWNGTQNIVVDVCWSGGTGSAGSILGDTRYYPLVASSTTSGSGCSLSATGRIHVRPQVRLFMATGSINGCLNAQGNSGNYQYPSSTYSWRVAPRNAGGAATGCTTWTFTVQAPTTWYADADDDGYGDPATTITACAQPAGHVANGDDCDDTNAAITAVG
jgi:hypothetical protein